MITCCKDCQKRQVGCHSNCEDYVAQRAEMTDENEREKKRHCDFRGYGVYASLKQRWRKKI